MATPKLDLLPYTIHCLPYGVISTASDPTPRCAVAIGEHAIDLVRHAKAGRLSSLDMGNSSRFEAIFAEVRLTMVFVPAPDS